MGGRINEVIYGVPDPHDSSLTPRPGYDDPSKLSRRQLKVQELRAAGDVVSVRALARKETACARRGLRGLLDHRVANSRPPTVDRRMIEAVLAVLAETTTDSTVSTVTLIKKVRA